MKILSATQIRDWDQYTMLHEPISSIDLMERAAIACTKWFLQQYPNAGSFSIFCGKGNNGGDGLAIARLLMSQGYTVTVYILEFGHKGTADFQANLERLHKLPKLDIHFIQGEQQFPSILQDQVVIDALFGSGLNRPLEGLTEALVKHINTSGRPVVSIDIPSGLFADHSSRGAVTVHADHTISFQCYKLAFLLPENRKAIGLVHLLDIGLHPGYIEKLDTAYEITDENILSTIYKPRDRFSHKGTFGHALLLAGSYGKMGAAVLAAKACLRSGAGLLTCYIPRCGYDIMQGAVPEAMVITDPGVSILSQLQINDLSRFNSIGIGPGVGTAQETAELVCNVLKLSSGKLVIDADALNILSSHKDRLKDVPAGSILTPHPKEFDRLFGETANDVERILLALTKAKELNCVVILKGHHSLIATPSGKAYFNKTGNAGMATAGSGDVLTGILTGLFAQDYSTVDAAILGAWLHGLAGNIAARDLSQEALIAGDIIDGLGKAFLSLKKV